MTITNHSRTADVEEMIRAVTSLVEVLDRTEKRSARFTRIIHWSLLGGLVLMVASGLLIAIGIGTAYASLDKFVFTIEEALIQNENVSKAVKIYIDKHGLDPVKEKDQAIIRKVVAERTVKVITDAIILFEELGDNPDATLQKIANQLHTMNEALQTMPEIKTHMSQMSQKMSSVPIMAAHMDLMNRNIASMTTSMGSTMGRMSKWMPW